MNILAIVYGFIYIFPMERKKAILIAMEKNDRF